ncbi:FAD-dependent oxidoreductase [Turicimonas muris]|uniref:FAD-dependent oxidoreductase n=1 Tax=Turicimonas muris TaxID=1796652 RepID=UPI0024948427|nr:flavocytochrome c [Turicimonas muris]
MTQIKSSRRNFLKASASLMAVAAPFSAYASEKPKYDEEVDVIVVGSGVSGTIAAIAAAEKGSKVLLIDKMSRLGGTSRISGLNFACVGSPLQKQKGVQDTPEKLASDMYKVSGNMGDYEKALEMAKNTAKAEKFMTERGVKWDGRLLKLGGHSEPRVLVSVGDGAGLLNALWTHMKTLKNLETRLHTKADEIILDKDGKVEGLEVRQDYYFDTPETDDLQNKTGTKKSIRAKQGVIFATGGYSRDKAFRSIEVPFLAGVATTTNPGATSGALKTMVRAGAQPMHLSLFRFAYPLPTEDMIWGVIVDPATGKRFMSEGATRNALAQTVLLRRMQNGDKKPFIIYDEKSLAKFHNLNRVQRSLNGLNGIDGTMTKFNSVEEAAKAFGADPAIVKNTVDAYNQAIKEGKDPEFNKPLERSGRKVEPLDFSAGVYAMPVNPRLNYTPGGIRTDLKARALSMETGKPIEGLFVVGEASGGLHGQERMTGCSMPECAVFGLIAGETVADRPKQ